MIVRNIDTISLVVGGTPCVDLEGNSRIFLDSAPDRVVFVSFKPRAAPHRIEEAGLPGGLVLNIRIDADGRAHRWLLGQALEERERLLRPFAAVFVAVYADRRGLTSATRIMSSEKVSDRQIQEAVESLLHGEPARGYEALGFPAAPRPSGTARIAMSAVSYSDSGYDAGVESPLAEDPQWLAAEFTPALRGPCPVVPIHS